MEGEGGNNEELPRPDREQDSVADEAQSWEEADRARREFGWFGERAANEAAAEATRPLREPNDRPVSPWSRERDLLDTAEIAALVASGLGRHEAAEQVETVTDRERYQRAVDAGVNAEDALPAVEGARLLQRLQADRKMRESQQRQMGDFIAASLVLAETGEVSSGNRFSGDIATDTRGELVPRFDYVNRRVDRLAIGDLIDEPRLPGVHVSLLVDGGYDPDRHEVALIQVLWGSSEDSHGGRLFRPDERLAVRVSSIEDTQAIEHALDRSEDQPADLDDRTGRLIAAHLQRGPNSQLYRLAVTGEVSDAVMTELEEVARSGRATTRRWAQSLRDYCRRQHDRGPRPGDEPE